MPASSLIRASRELTRQVDALRFAPPVRYVYNPLLYAREPHELYLSRYGRGRRHVVFVGMNPGPWGMAQTGVPFGEITVVREWLHVSGRVETPRDFHARVPVTGFDCTRSEVSGRRLWGLLRERFGTVEELRRAAFVANYCPLLFLDEAGRNLTPDRLSKEDRAALFPPCDRFLEAVIEEMRPQWVIGVGRFAFQRITAVLEAAAAVPGSLPPRALRIPHPSPASPQANRGWAAATSAVLLRARVWEARRARGMFPRGRTPCRG